MALDCTCVFVLVPIHVAAQSDDFHLHINWNTACHFKHKAYYLDLKWVEIDSS